MTELRRVWRTAEESGFDHLWGYDHFGGVRASISRPVYEGWTMLTAMAEATSRIRIGLMVTGNSYRHPGVLAKMAVTVDHLSQGRLEFGIGAGWAREEHEMLGIPFLDSAGDRIRQMDEAIQVVKLLWMEERASFDGTYYRLRDAVAEPKPFQRPHPPIWIGGSGERLTLRFAAQHASVWNYPGGTVEEAGRLAGVLDAHCATVGRSPDEVRRSVQFKYAGDDPAALIGVVRPYIAMGFTEVIIQVDSPNATHKVEQLASSVLPELHHS